MSNKIGRPKLPKGKAKGTQVNVRFDTAQDRKIDEAAALSGLNKVEWLRAAGLTEAEQQFWFECRWTYEELDNKRVEFQLPDKEGGYVRGVGSFMVNQNPDGLLRINIVCDIPEGRGAWSQYRIPLNQYAASKIKQHPNERAAHFLLNV